MNIENISREQKDNDVNHILTNRLIANFMGWIDSPYDNLPNKVYNKDMSEGKYLGHFNYHTSWDELIPVVKKIQQLPIDDFTKKKTVMSALKDVDIEILFNSVVVFLQWWSSSCR